MAEYTPVASMAEVLDPIGYRLKILRVGAWDRVAKAMRSRDDRTALIACDQILKRTDPVPTKDAIQITTQGPTLIVWDLSATEVPPPDSLRTERSAGSSNGSDASTRSCAIADGEKPPSESTSS